MIVTRITRTAELDLLPCGTVIARRYDEGQVETATKSYGTGWMLPGQDFGRTASEMADWVDAFVMAPQVPGMVDPRGGTATVRCADMPWFGDVVVAAGSPQYVASEVGRVARAACLARPLRVDWTGDDELLVTMPSDWGGSYVFKVVGRA